TLALGEGVVIASNGSSLTVTSTNANPVTFPLLSATNLTVSGGGVVAGGGPGAARVSGGRGGAARPPAHGPRGPTPAPPAACTGANGTGAAGTANVVNGVVTGVTITNPGSGYTAPPTVTFGSLVALNTPNSVTTSTALDGGITLSVNNSAAVGGTLILNSGAL